MELKQQLDNLYNENAHLNFIENDPISIPHRFSEKQDIEIAGFFAAIFAWGQRITIINKTNDLLERMDNAPFDFIRNHKEADRKQLLGFKHRTFNDEDLLYVVHRLQRYYREGEGLEFAFSNHLSSNSITIEDALVAFRDTFFNDQFAPARTKKHIATPANNSSCKRLCMYLRWMVRKDDVDFGIWKSMKPSQLMMPLDVHVERMARQFNLVTRQQRDWKTVVELTTKLREFDEDDPVKYDLALFGHSVQLN